MLGYVKNIKGERYAIGVEYLPERIKPCLMARIGNVTIKCASFNDAEAARYFMNFLADFLGAPPIDWAGDDIPMGLLIEKGE